MPEKINTQRPKIICMHIWDNKKKCPGSAHYRRIQRPFSHLMPRHRIAGQVYGFLVKFYDVKSNINQNANVLLFTLYGYAMNMGQFHVACV